MPATLKIEQGLSYGTVGTKPLLLDAYYLPSQTPRPAMILIHGGGWEYGSRIDFTQAAVEIAKQGYAVFAIDFRQSREGENIWPAPLIDIQRSVRWVRQSAQRFTINTDQVIAFGTSSGGHLASMLAHINTIDNSDESLKAYSSKVNAVVSYAGPSDLTQDFRSYKYIDDRTIQDIVDQLLGKPYAENRHIAAEASPILHITKHSAPHLLIHGDQDKLVHCSQSKLYHAALQKAKVPSSLLILPNTGHFVKNKLTLLLISQKIQSFLQKTFPAETP